MSSRLLRRGALITATLAAIAMVLLSFAPQASAQSDCTASTESCTQVEDLPSESAPGPLGPETIENRPISSPPAFGFGVNPQASPPADDIQVPTVSASSASADEPLARSGSESHGLIMIGIGLISLGCAVLAVMRSFALDR